MQSSWFDSPPKSFIPSPDNLPSTSHTIIRSASVDEAVAIAEVMTLSFNNFNGLTFWMYPLMKMGIAQDVRQRLENHDNNHRGIVAVNVVRIGKEIHQEIVGTIELSFHYNKRWHKQEQYGYIANLAVRKNYRRQGIATQLLSHCETIALEKNFFNLKLHVLSGNSGGQKLYLNNGYRVSQVETDLYSLFVPSKRRLLLAKSL